MIAVTVNGEEKTLSKENNLQQAIEQWQLAEGVFAIAVNNQFVPKTNYNHTYLHEGDVVELVVPMQGG